MDDPIRRSIDLRVPVERAFATWTEELDRWWPRDAGLRPGNITRVGPPHKLAFRVWLPGAGESEVVVRFRATGPATCHVELEHRGWHAQAVELLRRGRNLGSSIEVTPAPAAACGGCESRTMSLPAFRLLR